MLLCYVTVNKPLLSYLLLRLLPQSVSFVNVWNHLYTRTLFRCLEPYNYSLHRTLSKCPKLCILLYSTQELCLEIWNHMVVPNLTPNSPLIIFEKIFRKHYEVVLIYSRYTVYPILTVDVKTQEKP